MGVILEQINFKVNNQKMWGKEFYKMKDRVEFSLEENIY